MAPTPEVTFAEWRRAPGEVWRVRLSSFNGRPYIDIRMFFKGKGGDWLPTKKGVAMTVAHLAELSDALALALEHCRKYELVAPCEYEWR